MIRNFSNSLRYIFIVVLFTFTITFIVNIGIFETVAIQQPDNETVKITNTTVDQNSSGQIRVTLNHTDEGLAGYQILLRLHPIGIANLTGATYPPKYKPTTKPEVIENGQALRIEAADINNRIGNGTTNVTLAKINISGSHPGVTDVIISNLQIDGDNGSKIRPAINQGQITVQSTRFNTNGEPGIQRGEVVDAIVAFNSDADLGGQPVSRTDVVDVIVKFNS